MSDFSKLGEEHIKPSNRVLDIPLGAVRILPLTAMLVDADRSCWLDPYAEVIGGPDWRPTPRCTQGIEVVRYDEGFTVGRQFFYGNQWNRVVLPTRTAEQFPFLPVIAVYELVARS